MEWPQFEVFSSYGCPVLFKLLSQIIRKAMDRQATRTEPEAAASGICILIGAFSSSEREKIFCNTQIHASHFFWTLMDFVRPIYTSDQRDKLRLRTRLCPVSVLGMLDT
jgi:hypothetical protein